MKSELTKNLLSLATPCLVTGVYAIIVQSNADSKSFMFGAGLFLASTSVLWSSERLLRLWDYIVFKRTHKPALAFKVMINETPLSFADYKSITNSIQKKYMEFVEHKRQCKDKYDNDFLLGLSVSKIDASSKVWELKNVNYTIKVDCKYAKEFLWYIGSSYVFTINDTKIFITLDVIKKP